MTPTTALIKQLRDRTQADFPLIRQALVATNDLEAAECYVRAHSRKPKANEGGAGLIVSGTHQGRIGALVEVRCGTDFVARTDEFQTLCREIVLQVLAMGDEGLLEQAYIRDPGQSVADLVAECARKVGEAITVARCIRWTL